MIKKLELERRVELYKPSCKDGYYYNHDIPSEFQLDYQKAIVQYAKRYDFIAQGFHLLYGNPAYKWQDFLQYMKETMGFGITISCFENPTGYEIAGTWYWDDATKKNFTIHVNASDPYQRQKMTIAHECMHALQDFDFGFQEELRKYPISLQLRIAERVAEKAAIEVFMPREQVACDRLAGLNVYEIALKYDVSKAVASYH